MRRVWTIGGLAVAILSASPAIRPHAAGGSDRARLGATLALSSRIELPGGSQLMLRPEYKFLFRSLRAWSEGLILERAYLA